MYRSGLFCCIILTIQCNYIALGLIKKTLLANVGESRIVKVESPNGIIIDCSILPPNGGTFIGIISGNKESNLEYIRVENRSCSFNIKNITENSFGDWRVRSKYQSSDKYFEDEAGFDITGNPSSFFHSEIGKSLVVNVPSRREPLAGCLVRRPLDSYFLNLMEPNLEKSLKYTGYDNNSCSFKIISVTDNHIGTWHVRNFYQSNDKKNNQMQLENFFFNINGMENKQFHKAVVGKPLTVDIFSRDDTQVDCDIRPPNLKHVSPYSEKWETNFKFLHDKNHHCSFKFNKLTPDLIGKWLLDISYISDFEPVPSYKNVTITIWT